MAHASDSSEQRAMEVRVLTALGGDLGVDLTCVRPPALAGMRLDGFAAGVEPVLVEVFAHVGSSKAGQQHKIADDMTRLLLAERLLGVPCRKLIAVIDPDAVKHLVGGWRGQFSRAFGIEVRVVHGFAEAYAALRQVQQRQVR
jgi:hypothetical protein